MWIPAFFESYSVSYYIFAEKARKKQESLYFPADELAIGNLKMNSSLCIFLPSRGGSRASPAGCYTVTHIPH
jgi:hypothetical protein